MTVVKYDNSDVETGGSGEQPPAGKMYPVKLASVTDRRPDKNDLEVIVDFGSKYSRVWSYVNFGEASKWKFREFTDACGLKPKGQFDTSKLEGKKLNVKVTADTYEGEYRARIGRWLKPGSDNGDEPEMEADDDTEAEEPKASANGGGGLDPELAEDLKADADFYEEWDDDDIKSYFSDLELEIEGRKTRKKMIDAIVEFAEQQSDGDGGTDTAKEPDDDYPDWTVDELKEEVKERNEKADASIEIVGRPSKDKLVAALREDDKKEPF